MTLYGLVGMGGLGPASNSPPRLPEREDGFGFSAPRSSSTPERQRPPLVSRS